MRLPPTVPPGGAKRSVAAPTSSQVASVAARVEQGYGSGVAGTTAAKNGQVPNPRR
jgi:hypothetical protein